MKPWIKPGYLSQVMRADERRMEFDCKNQTLIQKECKVDMVFIGDSIIQMWELSAYFQEYPLRIINRGIGGDRTSSLLHRFRADAVQLKPKIVVIMAGINDSWDLEVLIIGSRKKEKIRKYSARSSDKYGKNSKDFCRRTSICSALLYFTYLYGMDKPRT